MISPRRSRRLSLHRLPAAAGRGENFESDSSLNSDTIRYEKTGGGVGGAGLCCWVVTESSGRIATARFQVWREASLATPHTPHTSHTHTSFSYLLALLQAIATVREFLLSFCTKESFRAVQRTWMSLDLIVSVAVVMYPMNLNSAMYVHHTYVCASPVIVIGDERCS